MSEIGAGEGAAIPPPSLSLELIPDSAFKQGARALLRDRMAILGLLTLLLAIFAAIAAPFLAPYDPDAGDGASILAPPFTANHWLGADEQGRDILSRILFGARLAFPEAVIPVLCAAIVGTFLGLIGGYFKGLTGELVMRSLDVVFAIPMVLLAVAIATTLGSGLPTVILSMAVVITPYIARVVATTTAQLRSAPFIDAARCAGLSERRILAQEVIPHVVPAVIVYGATNMGAMVVFAAGFGFLGLGAPPNQQIASGWPSR